MNRKKLLQSGRKSSKRTRMVFAIIVLLVSAALLGLDLRNRVLGARITSEIAARCAADAGLTKAISEMNGKLKIKPWDDSNLPRAIDEALPNCDATISYTVTGDSINGYTINSIGKLGQAKRRINCTLRLQGLFEYAIFTQSHMVFKPGTIVNGYNFDSGDENLPVRIGTNSIKPMSIIIGNDAIINGDVAVGVGGDPDAVISAEQATIMGKTFALSSKRKHLTSATVPEWLESMPSLGTVGGSTTITASGKYDSIDLGMGDSVTIDGPVTLYVTGDVRLSNSAQVLIVDANTNPDASLTLYLGGLLSCETGGMFNNLTTNPKKLKIYGLDSCTSMTFATTSVFYGTIYAPNTLVNLKNAVEIFGAVIADRFIQAKASNFHYDISLAEASVNDEYVSFAIKRWHEYKWYKYK